MINFILREDDEYIKLGQLLKAARLVGEGSAAKHVILDGQVTVNGEVCLMRGKKICDHDIVRFGKEEIHVHRFS